MTIPANGLPPVAVGGVGGSGTRLVAELLRRLGLHLGTDLNDASDTLWFTLLFKRIEVLDCCEDEFDTMTGALLAGLAEGMPLAPAEESLVHALATQGRPQHPASWLRARAESLVAATRQSAHHRRWGWKEPNTHVVIERLWQRLPDLCYIHVVRNGVDMSTSANQNQLRLWGTRVLGCDGPVSPGRSLAYWCRIHQRMQHLLAQNPQRMLWLDYDKLCRNPAAEAEVLAEFLGYPSRVVLDALPPIMPPPPREPPEPWEFDPMDLEYAASLGYGAKATGT